MSLCASCWAFCFGPLLVHPEQSMPWWCANCAYPAIKGNDLSHTDSYGPLGFDSYKFCCAVIRSGYSIDWSSCLAGSSRRAADRIAAGYIFKRQARQRRY